MCRGSQCGPPRSISLEFMTMLSKLDCALPALYPEPRGGLIPLSRGQCFIGRVIVLLVQDQISEALRGFLSS